MNRETLLLFKEKENQSEDEQDNRCFDFVRRVES